MFKNTLFKVSILLITNIFAFITLYYVYFPWMSRVDSQIVEEQILSDVREINYRMSVLDYHDSPQTIARASFELDVEINSRELKQLKLGEPITEELTENRHAMHMDQVLGNMGYVLLSDNSTVLTLGPYGDEYNDIMIKDWLAYALILIIFNGFVVMLIRIQRQKLLAPAYFALDKITNDSIIINKKYLSTQDIATYIPALVDKIDKLKKKSREQLNSQRDLMHAVAHEFRGPMARMSFALDMLKDTTDKERVHELSDEVDTTLDELDELVNEVLGYSRIKDGKQPLKLAEFDAIRLILDILEKVETVYPEKNFHINHENLQQLNVVADRHLLHRGCINLIRNAARFCKANVYITLSTYQDSFDITIEDDGPGIAPGKRERIFEPFTRLEHSRNRDSGGVGLGLAIVKGIITKHDGYIWVEDSREYLGASFTIHLPLVSKNSGMM